MSDLEGFDTKAFPLLAVQTPPVVTAPLELAPSPLPVPVPVVTPVPSPAPTLVTPRPVAAPAKRPPASNAGQTPMDFLRSLVGPVPARAVRVTPVALVAPVRPVAQPAVKAAAKPVPTTPAKRKAVVPTPLVPEKVGQAAGVAFRNTIRAIDSAIGRAVTGSKPEAKPRSGAPRRKP